MAETTQARAPRLGRATSSERVPRGALPAAGWRVGIGVLWLSLVFLAYYAVHKPITAGDLAALWAPVQQLDWQLSRVIARLLGALGGQAIWRAARWPEPQRLEARLIGTVVGLGMLGLAGFVLGSLGILTRPFALGLLALPTAALASDILRTAHWWGRSARDAWRAGWRGGAIDRIALLFCAATISLLTLAALLPPTTAWDALSYHLVSARADAAAGHLVLDPGNPQVYQPQVMEMLYALLLLARGGDGPAALLHAACGLIVVALVACWAWRAGGPRTAVRAAAIVLALPVVALVATWPYVDLGLAATELAALTALIRWHAAARASDRRAARGWLLAAGLTGGVGLDIKYTGAYAVLALAALVAVAAWRMGGRADWAARLTGALRPTFIFMGVALVVGSIWPLRNLLVAGDPVFPYHLGPLFPSGPDWDAGRTMFMQGRGWGAMALWRGPLLPLEATLLGQLTLRRRARQSDVPAPAGARAAEPAQGPASPSLALLLFWPLGFAALLMLIWGEELMRSDVARQSRLYLALFLALAGPAAVVWGRLESVRVPAVSLGRLVNAGVVLVLLLTLASQAVQTLQLDTLAELVGAQPRAAYLEQQLGPYAAAMRELDGLGSSARVLFLWEPRTYLTTAHVEPDVYLDSFNAHFRRCGDAPGIALCLRREGFTHVLLYQQGLRFVRSQPHAKDTPVELAALDRLTATWRRVYGDSEPLVGPGGPGAGWYVLYALGNPS